jgi:uncharacterized protein (DUF2132 family)
MDRPPPRSRDPLHGITLETIVCGLVAKFGWEEMGAHIPIRCFLQDPSVKSSLTFLRKTPWARKKVEDWFVAEVLEPPRGD